MTSFDTTTTDTIPLLVSTPPKSYEDTTTLLQDIELSPEEEDLDEVYVSYEFCILILVVCKICSRIQKKYFEDFIVLFFMFN